jgi:LuxR family maltose regulon positive regulatory protein
MAVCAYEANDLAQARELARRGREEYLRYGLQHRGLLAADEVLILAPAGLGAWEEAWHHLGELRGLNPESRRVAPLLSLLAAELHLRQGDLAAAQRALDEAVGDFPDEIGEQHTLTTIRLLLARRELTEDALHHLAQLEDRVRAGGRVARLISVHILQALVHDALAQPQQASDRLAAAIQIAAPEGYLRRFLNEGPGVAPLLPSVRTVAPAFVDQLQRAFGAVLSDTSAAGADDAGTRLPLIEPLTQQERSILGLLAEGCSYREIAERLFISAGTVR